VRVGPGTGGGVILEAFKPGTAPPDSYSVIGYTDQQQEPGSTTAPPDADRAARRGTGLY
jgi:penicillin-binding protein 1A